MPLWVTEAVSDHEEIRALSPPDMGTGFPLWAGGCHLTMRVCQMVVRRHKVLGLGAEVSAEDYACQRAGEEARPSSEHLARDGLIMISLLGGPCFPRRRLCGPILAI